MYEFRALMCCGVAFRAEHQLLQRTPSAQQQEAAASTEDSAIRQRYETKMAEIQQKLEKEKEEVPNLSLLPTLACSCDPPPLFALPI